MEDHSRKTVWRRFGSPMGTRTEVKWGQDFRKLCGEVAFPPSFDRKIDGQLTKSYTVYDVVFTVQISKKKRIRMLISFALMSDWTNVNLHLSQLIRNRFVLRLNISANVHKSSFTVVQLDFKILFSRQEYLVQIIISAIDLERLKYLFKRTNVFFL